MVGEIRNVFISHVHEDDEGLSGLKDLLSKRGFEIRDASISAEKPNAATSPEYIKAEILGPRIKWAGTFIVYITPRTRDSEWVKWEIDYAQKMGKRIVGIWAHGASESDLPDGLDDYADAVVGWNSDRIIDAIDGTMTSWRTPTGEPRPERQIARFSCRPGRGS